MKHSSQRIGWRVALFALVGVWLLVALANGCANFCRCQEPVGSRATVGGPRYSDGTEVTCDLPATEMLKNKAGVDGSGLCVFSSLDHSARWQNCQALVGFRDFMTHYPGGGYPTKVDQFIPKMAQSKGLPAPPYVQHTGGDPALLDLAIKTGRMPAVTYGYSERYGRPIAHMVNLVHLDQKWACVLDNNFPGADKLEWMDREEFLRRWRMMGGGWCIVLLEAPPPPVPEAVPEAEKPFVAGFG
jgi:hypothetical protein